MRDSGLMKVDIFKENPRQAVIRKQTLLLDKHKIPQTTPKVLLWKGQKRKIQGRKKGTKEDSVAVSEKRLWELHSSTNRKGVKFHMQEKRHSFKIPALLRGMATFDGGLDVETS